MKPGVKGAITMGRIKNMLGINRQTALLSVAQGSPLTACYFLLQVQPVVSHGLKELEDTILNAEDKLYSLEYDLFCQIRDAIAAEMERIQKTG